MRQALVALVVIALAASCSQSGDERSEGGMFSAGNLWFMFEIHSGKFGYLIVSDGVPQILPDAQGDRNTVALRYSDGAVINASCKPGQTLWIDKDHQSKIIPNPLSASQILLLRDRRADVHDHLSSPQDLRNLVARLE